MRIIGPLERLLPRFSTIFFLVFLAFFFSILLFSPLAEASFGGTHPSPIYKDQIYGSASTLGQTLMIPRPTQQNANTELLSKSSAELKVGQTPVVDKI